MKKERHNSRAPERDGTEHFEYHLNNSNSTAYSYKGGDFRRQHFLFLTDNQALTLHHIPDYLSDRRTRSARTMAVIASTTTGALSAKHTS